MSTSPRRQLRSASINPQKPDMSTFRPPKSTLSLYVWRWKTWIGATFVTAMLEPWETLVLLTFILSFIGFFIGGLYRYLPSEVFFLVKRAQYYVKGGSIADYEGRPGL